MREITGLSALLLLALLAMVWPWWVFGILCTIIALVLLAVLISILLNRRADRQILAECREREAAQVAAARRRAGIERAWKVAAASAGPLDTTLRLHDVN